MANDIRIPVRADTGGAVSSIENIEKSTRRVADAVKDVGRSSGQASAGFARVEQSAKRLEQVARILSREFGRAVDPQQAEKFLQNFEEMRTGRTVTGASKVRQFGTFEQWLENNSRLFLDPREAERYRRRVFAFAARGTGLPDIPGAPVRTDPDDSPVERWFARNQRRFGRAAMRVGGTALGLAGIMGITAMAGRSVELARDESVSQDQLLRSIGDLGTEFERLRDQVRLSGEGLGVAFGEAATMAREFANIANATASTDIYGNLRTAFGFARAYGMDVQTSVGFMAQMRQFGAIDAGDRSGRRFALMIAEAIERGGVTAKANEVLAAVASFTSSAAKMALTAPDAAAFAGALASMTRTGTPGLDPSSAASIISAADMAMRRGGGMGEAGINFTYGALSRVHGPLNPIIAMAIAEQGIFGSGADLRDSPLGRYLGDALPELGDKTNLEAVMEEINRQYGDSAMRLDAIKNFFGLSSYQQAAAFAQMEPEQIGAASGLLARVGVDASSLSASGIQNIAALSVAGGAGLRQIAEKQLARTDDPLTEGERERLTRAMESGDDDALRQELARIMSMREQEANIGTETRDAVKSLEDTLTSVGGQLLKVITPIQKAVVAMAGKIAPESDFAREVRLEEEYRRYVRDREELQEKVDAEARARAEKEQEEGESTRRRRRIYVREGASERRLNYMIRRNPELEARYQEEMRQRALREKEREEMQARVIAESEGRNQMGAPAANQDGGRLPRGNPVGTAPREQTINVNIGGSIRDERTGQEVEIEAPPTRVSVPMAPGAA